MRRGHPRLAVLREDPKLPGQRVRELIEPLGYRGGKTILDDCLREVRPMFCPPPRMFQRTVYRPGEMCQLDLWESSVPVPVGHGERRRGWVVVACLGYSGAGAGALVFSKETRDLLWGNARCLWSLGALPQTLVWDRQAGIHAREGRPTSEFAALCGLLRVGWPFCEPARSAGQGRRRAPAGLSGDPLRARPALRQSARPHLSIALRIRACLAGHRVAFRTATEWVALLADAQCQGRLDSELDRLQRIPLLIVDDVGYIPFDPHAANLMFMRVSRRYERASLIVTSNKPFSGWGEIFGDDIVAAAMMTDSSTGAEILALKGHSDRLKDRDLARPPRDD
jgi:hypothetical protein